MKNYSATTNIHLLCSGSSAARHRARIRDHLLERQQRRWDLNNKQTLTTSAAHSCNIAHWPQWMRFNLSIPKASLPRVSYEQTGTLKQETSARQQGAEPLQLLKQQYWRKGKKKTIEHIFLSQNPGNPMGKHKRWEKKKLLKPETHTHSGSPWDAKLTGIDSV